MRTRKISVEDLQKYNFFVDTYHPIAGWKAVLIGFTTEDPGGGFWEPYETSPVAFDTKAEALEWGKSWALSVEVPIKIDGEYYMVEEV